MRIFSNFTGGTITRSEYAGTGICRKKILLGPSFKMLPELLKNRRNINYNSFRTGIRPEFLKPEPVPFPKQLNSGGPISDLDAEKTEPKPVCDYSAVSPL